MWETINKIKSKLKNSLIIMTGYHSMRKPEETLNNSLTDIVILSNHVDFVLDKLMDDLKVSNFSIKKLSCDGIAYKNSNGEFINQSFKKVENINNQSTYFEGLYYELYTVFSISIQSFAVAGISTS
jgi:hypothetical protein